MKSSGRDQQPAERRKKGKLPQGSAIVYARVANAKQPSGRESIARQLQLCERKATDLRLKVFHEFVDIGRSGLNTDRPGLREAFAYLRREPTDYVIVETKDRLARNILARATTVVGLQRLGTTLLSASEDDERDH